MDANARAPRGPERAAPRGALALRSVHHVHRQRRGVKHIAGCTAEHQFADPGVAVAAHHQQIGTRVGSEGEHRLAHLATLLRAAVVAHRINVVLPKVGLDAKRHVRLAPRFALVSEVHAFCALQQRQGEGHGPGRFAA